MSNIERDPQIEKLKKEIEAIRATNDIILEKEKINVVDALFLTASNYDQADAQIEDQLEIRKIYAELAISAIRALWPDDAFLTNQVSEQDLANKKINSIILFVGKQGIPPWKTLARRDLLRLYSRQKKKIILVILSTAKADKVPALPFFLVGQITQLDFRNYDTEQSFKNLAQELINLIRS